MYYVKLINGVTYHLHDVTYFKGVEREVDKEIYEYLKDNAQFEVSEVEEKAPEVPEAPETKEKAPERKPIKK